MLFYTAKIAARKAGVTSGTIRRRARLKKIGRHLGRDWVFTAPELTQLISFDGRPGRRRV